MFQARTCFGSGYYQCLCCLLLTAVLMLGMSWCGGWAWHELKLNSKSKREPQSKCVCLNIKNCFAVFLFGWTPLIVIAPGHFFSAGRFLFRWLLHGVPSRLRRGSNLGKQWPNEQRFSQVFCAWGSFSILSNRLGKKALTICCVAR